METIDCNAKERKFNRIQGESTAREKDKLGGQIELFE